MLESNSKLLNRRYELKYNFDTRFVYQKEQPSAQESLDNTENLREDIQKTILDIQERYLIYTTADQLRTFNSLKQQVDQISDAESYNEIAQRLHELQTELIMTESRTERLSVLTNLTESTTETSLDREQTIESSGFLEIAEQARNEIEQQSELIKTAIDRYNEAPTGGRASRAVNVARTAAERAQEAFQQLTDTVDLPPNSITEQVLEETIQIANEKANEARQDAIYLQETLDRTTESLNLMRNYARTAINSREIARNASESIIEETTDDVQASIARAQEAAQSAIDAANEAALIRETIDGPPAAVIRATNYATQAAAAANYAMSSVRNAENPTPIRELREGLAAIQADNDKFLASSPFDPEDNTDIPADESEVASL